MAYETMTLERDGAIATLTLSRPEKLNAVSERLLLDLAAVSEELENDAETRVVILTGAGRAFSSGADINEFPDKVETSAMARGRRRSRAGWRALKAFTGLEQVTIAAVNGWAVGGGFSLLLACDLRVLSADARFFIPEVDFGVPYVWTSTPLLVKAVGASRAKELIMTGRRFDAAEADRLGLANRVVPADQVLSAARELAETIASKPPMGIRLTKNIVNALTSVNLGEAGGYEPDLMAGCWLDPAMSENRQRFLTRER